MLNLTEKIRFSRKDKKHLRKLRKKYGGTFTYGSWGDGTNETKRIKRKISYQLLRYQKLKCVYCELWLFSRNREIDHFAPRKHNPEYSFEALNLFYSCGQCNSSFIKGEKPTVIQSNGRYHQCTFNILHPIFDDVDYHIKYQDADRINLDFPKCSNLGLRTIDFFKMDSILATIKRTKELRLEIDNPLTTKEEKELIGEILAYK